ncbi:MAG: non-canonical purine NTP pyrophosphatase [Alphaproteobacteria bacterium]
MDKLVIASHNQGKVVEIQDLLKDVVREVISAADLNLPEPEEDQDSFIGNAQLKSVAACIASGLPALSDDSGLCVDCLNGAPGIYSARWAGPLKDFDLAMVLIHEKMEQHRRKQPYGVSPLNDRASMVCVLSLAIPNPLDLENPHIHNFEGRVEGMMAWPPRGKLGFGYDPMFQPLNEALTFGEMAPADKHAISHRALAFQQLLESKLFE